MEPCHGGDLFTRIKQKGALPEQKAATVCRNVASVLAYAHQNGLMHRDIKPENILLVSGDSDTDIRVADWGSSAFFRPAQKLNQLVGSPLYIAPSVLRHEYGTEADLWSLGVVLHILLTGLPPFWGRNNAETFHCILNQPLNISHGRIRSASAEAVHLVTQLLNRNVEETITASDVLGLHL